MALVSVVIPVYNAQFTKLDAVNSVLSQTLTDLELIVINDGSTDKTLQILEQVEDPRLQVVSFTNAGLATSRNRGLLLARSQYISFLDADDLWVPEKLEFQVSALYQDPTISAVYSWTKFIDESGKFLHLGLQSNASGHIYRELFTKNFLESGSNILVKRMTLVNIGGFDETLTVAEDWDCYLRLAAEHSFAVIPKFHVLYRQVSNSLSSNLLRQENDSIRVLNSALERSPTQLGTLKSLAFANLYLYLTVKALQAPLSREKGFFALHFISKMSLYNFSYWSQHLKLLLILSLKIIVSILMPEVYNHMKTSK
jgi:glycosyltransferase involved in cell wall biosynthesis